MLELESRKDAGRGRSSGIPGVGDVQWGAHFCQFYQDANDLADTLIPYFAAGLADNEFCLWVTSEPFGTEDALAAMRKAVPDLGDRLDKGQIEVFGHREWYGRLGQRGRSGASGVLDHWLDMEKRARDRGFAGLRLTGNTAWLERSGWDEFVAYERAVNEAFARFRIIGLCTYCLGRCCAQDVLDVVENHQFAIARRRGGWEVIENSSLKAAKAELKRLNDDLECRVRDRTMELEQATAAAENSRRDAEAANRSKDHFLAVLSHELRTPLTPVLASVTYLEAQRDVEPGLRAELELIRRNVELEARLIDDLLDLTRIARGKVHLHNEVVDAHACLRAALTTCQQEASAKRLELSLNLWAARPHVWADPARIQQVFCNLISNAVKFTPPGGRVTLLTGNDADGNFVAEVADTGAGIEAAALGRIFNAFEQGEQTIQRQFGGLGLGLTISKGLVDMHGGRLTAVSEGQGKGATFTLELKAVEHAASPAAPPGPRLRGSPARPATILLVEDHPDTLRVMARLLRSLGHHVLTADTVASARRLADEAVGQFDLLVSDLGLPDGSGMDLIRELKGRHGVRGIALSGFGMDEDVRRSLEAGFDHHLTKPVSFAVLTELVDRLLAPAGRRTRASTNGD